MQCLEFWGLLKHWLWVVDYRISRVFLSSFSLFSITYSWSKQPKNKKTCASRNGLFTHESRVVGFGGTWHNCCDPATAASKHSNWVVLVRLAVFSVEQQESSHSTFCRHICTHRAGNMLQSQHKTESGATGTLNNRPSGLCACWEIWPQHVLVPADYSWLQLTIHVAMAQNLLGCSPVASVTSLLLCQACLKQSPRWFTPHIPWYCSYQRGHGLHS